MDKTSSPKVILITGCSSGFGLLTAARLAASGHRVYATMRNLDKKQALADEMEKRGVPAGARRAVPLQLDVTAPSSIKTVVQEIEKEEKHIDVVVNNAGYAIGGFFEDLTQDEIRGQMETNFFGVQNVTREVIPLMRVRKQGTIINISSVAGLYTLPALGAYHASKWALEGFSESLYYELKPFGIHVCLIEPGTYRTKIFYENRQYAKQADDEASPYFAYTQHFKNQVTRLADADKKDPEDIARLVEKLIHAKNPAFRNIPDRRSRVLWALRRFLPFRLFSGLLYKLIFAGVTSKGGSRV